MTTSFVRPADEFLQHNNPIICGMTCMQTTQTDLDRLQFASELPQLLGLSKNIKVVVGNQVHGQQIACINNSHLDTDDSVIEIPSVDALITKCHNILIGVYTADCVPIVLCDSQQGLIAVIHAGRVGTQLQLVRRTIGQMIDQGCKAQQITAWIAPCICADHYQVTQQMAEDFRATFPQYPQIIQGPEQRHLALAETNRLEIISCGIPQQQVWLDTRCTFEEKDRLHSYRRDAKQAGRMLTFIGMIDPV